MGVNYKLCNDIVEVWNNALFDGCTKTEAIKILDEVFQDQHMNIDDVQHLYKTNPDARYMECGVTTWIQMDSFRD